jgi:drug/metabolite transporter (DMT)-like permease
MDPSAAQGGDHASFVKANRLGVLSMIGAMACFIVNDGLVKYVSQTLPAAQLIFVRGVMASILVLAVAQAMGATARIGEIARGWVATRAIVDAIAAFLYLVSLFHLPIANATAINMASPLLITALAAMFMSERVGLSRWLAIGAGFIGVLLIIQPQAEGFNVFALVCFLATLLLAIRDLLTRRVHIGVSSILVTLSASVAITILAGALSLLEAWRPLDAFELGLLAIAAVFLAAAYYLIVSCTRHAEFSLTAPFRYTGLLFATFAGYVVWGDEPNVLAWCGMGLLIGSGIFILRASGRARTAPAMLD